MNKIPISQWETGSDSGGGYWIDPETKEKWRWNGPVVGSSNTFIGMPVNKFEWIKRIIETSTNQFHLEGAKRLIELLYELEKDEKQKDELELLRIQKWNDIHTIL